MGVSGDGGTGVDVSVGVGDGVTGVDVWVGVSVGGASVNVGVAVGGMVGVPVLVDVAVSLRVGVAVAVGNADVLVGEGKSSDVGVRLAAGVASSVAPGKAARVESGTDVAVGVDGRITTATGVPSPVTGVPANRATSVAASAPNSGFKGANEVPSMGSRP